MVEKSGQTLGRLPSLWACLFSGRSWPLDGTSHGLRVRGQCGPEREGKRSRPVTAVVEGRLIDSLASVVGQVASGEPEAGDQVEMPVLLADRDQLIGHLKKLMSLTKFGSRVHPSLQVNGKPWGFKARRLAIIRSCRGQDRSTSRKLRVKCRIYHVLF